MPIGKQFNPLSAKLKPKIGYTPAKHKLVDTLHGYNYCP